MEPIALVALVHAHPEGFREATWIGQMLREQWPPYVPPGDAASGRVRAWVVGGVQDNETLVQSRPVVRDPRADFVADLLRAPTQTTLAAYATTPAGSSDNALPPPLAMVRFQRWIGVHAEGELPGPDPEALRARLRGLLPDFLIRSGGPVGDRELAALSFLAILHAAGELGKAYASPAAIRRGLLALDDRLGRPAACNIMVSDGRSVGVLHRGGSLISLTPPPPPRPARAISQPHLRPTASLLLLDPAARHPAADHLPEGVFTVHVRQPAVHERE
ncbi:MAG: hypothetical protein IPO88_13580 [Nannocystis sp.]|uniref:hypothetical protein n=1 Tax=Nannocystis sp. TaxID=1962667 RepID=UPI00242589AF|nr:hypothetical protein [Nannocystis sp.]MBK9754510.1 hypothetical protein [Nannocystis sp.]